MWSEATAVGQHFIISGNLTEVIGIAQDGKCHDLQDSPQPVVYLPLSQDENGDCVFVVRSRRTPSEMTAALERVLRSLAPNVSVTVGSWSDSVDDQLFPARVATTALGVMGLLAAMLAITGTFGMAAYGVSRRMKELGIRAALGAGRSQVMNAALKRPLILLGVGAAAGLLSCIFASRLLGRIVYQANPRDPLVLIGVLLMMTLIGMLRQPFQPEKRLVSIHQSSCAKSKWYRKRHCICRVH
jgi:ABC-type antimicrobial peptide transport system permease subunit